MLYMTHRLLDMRESEVEALAEMHGVSSSPGGLNLRLLPNDSVFSPLRMMDVPNELAACKIGRRSVLSKGVFELWGWGNTLSQLKESLRRCAPEVKEPWFRPHLSFKWVVDGFGKRLAQPRQIELMTELTPDCPFQVRARYAVGGPCLAHERTCHCPINDACYHGARYREEANLIQIGCSCYTMLCKWLIHTHCDTCRAPSICPVQMSDYG
jgi:hypothetical protein